MTTAARRARGTETAIALGVAVVAAAGAVLALLVSPVLAVAAILGVATVVGIIEDPAFGAMAVTAFVILQLPEVATDFHGAPTTFPFLIAVIGLAVWARSIRTGEPIAGAGRVGVAIAVLLSAAMISLITSAEAATGLGAAIGFAKDAAVAIVIGLLVRRSATLRQVIWVALAGGMFLAGLSILQFLTDSFGSNFAGFAQSNLQHVFGTYDDIRVSGPIEDPNFYAQWMVMLLPLAIDRFHDEVSPSLRLVAAASAAMSVAVVIITFSRGALLALVIVGGLMVLRHPPRPVTVGAIVVLGLMALPFLPTGYVDRLAAIADVGGTDIGTDPSIRAREAEAVASTQMFLEHPLSGIGYGTYLTAYRSYVRDLGIEQANRDREAHNLYLETAAETGIIGLVALASVIGMGAAALMAGRRAFRSMGDLRSDGIGYALGVALVGYLVTSIFLHMAFSRPMWLLAGLAFALPGIAAAEDDRRNTDLVRQR